MVYARTIESDILNFGVSGLDRGTLILYDAETRSRWSQLIGEAVEGEKKGQRLRKLPSTMTTWAAWRALHPESTVYIKSSVPYGARFTGDALAGLAEAEPGPVRKTDLVIGVEGHIEARAYLGRRLLQAGRLVHDDLEQAPILIVLAEDQATGRVYDRRVEERELTFELEGDRLHDAESGSTWDAISGQAIAGPLEGQRLRELVSTYSLWFAWQKYRPDTSVHGEAQAVD